jgi:hypothetical protein
MSKSEAKSEAKPEPKPEPGAKPKSPPKPQSGDNRRGAIAGLVIAILILGVGWWLARDLTSGRARCRTA